LIINIRSRQAAEFGSGAHLPARIIDKFRTNVAIGGD